MLIERKSVMTGRTHSVELPVTEEQVRKYDLGMYVQDAFPQLSEEECEFMMTGITEEEWHLELQETFPEVGER